VLDREELRAEDLVPNGDLKERIVAWKRGKRTGSGSAAMEL
jgi:hypothetical protein